jgi:hypothetical protein
MVNSITPKDKTGRLGSFYLGPTVQTKEPYVTSLRLSFGMVLLGINLMVLVPLTRPPTPFANRPNSFADEMSSLRCRPDAEGAGGN